MSKEHVATYLNHHLAGSIVVLEILQHLEAEAADLAPHIAKLRTEIEVDHRDLKLLMHRLGISESRIRKVSGWIAEQLTEVALEVDDESRGALRRLERLEAVAIGIDGKLALWRALKAAAEVEPELRGPAFEDLSKRAEEQRRQVEVFRLEAASSALRL
jgi:hypothetical protein